MTKVITYGTYDLLHYGHIRLLERAKALGDYLIVAVTADAFDRSRGKINVQQSLMERIEAVRATGIADEIIVEEYEGQKIDDIKRYQIDIFTVGSDWVGKFDYLNEYCRVVYLDRTQGVSSSEIRSDQRKLRLGMVGVPALLRKIQKESTFVNGLELFGVAMKKEDLANEDEAMRALPLQVEDYDDLLPEVDAVYIASNPLLHAEQIKKALLAGCHVLCESPIAMSETECLSLFALAKEKGLVLMESLKTAYSTAYYRLLLLVKSGEIGKVVSVDSTCTSLVRFDNDDKNMQYAWNNFCYWGPTAMLPIFQLLGTDFCRRSTVAQFWDRERKLDSFSRVEFLYGDSVATMKVANGVKSEGELIISGTRGYVYVPAPWWKTDYFEIRYENAEKNKRYFYQLDGEGIRNQLATFARATGNGRALGNIDQSVSAKIADTVGSFYAEKDLTEIQF